MYAHGRYVDDIVTLHSEVLGRDKERILLDTDIFMQTSRHEGMPIGILEALSYGIPCLVTKGTTLGEYIEKNNAGWCCENSSESIARGILQAVDESVDYMVKGNNARNSIQKDFSWEAIEKQTLDKYKKVYNN